MIPSLDRKRQIRIIVRMNVVLNRSVVVDSDWRFDNLCSSHLQSQSELYHGWYHILFIFILFFLRVVQTNLWSGVLLPFFFRGREEKVPFFPLEGYVVNTPFFIQYQTQIHSIRQFFTGSFAVHLRDHLRSRIICCPFWGSFAVLYSTDVVLLIKSISFMTSSLSSPLVKLPMFA